jgi:hypothetical protein
MRRAYSQSGSAMTLSVVIALVVAATSVTLLQQAQLTEDVTYLPRLKSTQSVIEGNIRVLAQQTLSYSCTANDMSTCTLNTEPFQDLIAKANQACANPDACRFVLDNPRFDSASQSFRATLRNDSSVVSLANREIVIDVPPEVFYRAQMLCPNEAPFFLGFSALGQPQCRPLGWSGPTSCPAGQFVRAIDGRTLSVSCGSLQNTVTCPAGQVLRGLRWANEGGFESLGCAPKISPYQFWSFTPNVDTSGLAIIDDTLPTPTAPGNYSVYRATTTSTTPPPMAACGPAAYTTHSAAPGVGLCSTGTPSTVTDGATAYTWTCTESTDVAHCSGRKTTAPPATLCWSRARVEQGYPPSFSGSPLPSPPYTCSTLGEEAEFGSCWGPPSNRRCTVFRCIDSSTGSCGGAVGPSSSTWVCNFEPDPGSNPQYIEMCGTGLSAPRSGSCNPSTDTFTPCAASCPGGGANISGGLCTRPVGAGAWAVPTWSCTCD